MDEITPSQPQTPLPPPPPPPVAPPPPPIVPSAKAQSPQKKGRGWMIAAVILFVLLGISVLMNFGQLISGLADISSSGSRHSAGPRLEEVTLEDHDSSDKIVVLPIEGVITGAHVDGTSYSMVDIVREQLRRAKKDKHVQAVVLKVDSPGGEVLASDEIAKAIKKFQDDSGKPVIVSMGNLAASGGYYVSAPCRYIVANDLTITGSIRVIMHGWNYRGLMDKVGIAPMTYKSGKFKDMLSGEREPSEILPEEREMVQSLIDETYGRFKEVVAEGRGNAHDLNKKEGKALAEDWADYADGRVMSGTQALELGFVDDVGDFDDTVERAFEIAHVTDANLIEYRERYDLSNFLSMFGQSEKSHDIKRGLGIEAPKLRAGLMYFLYQP